MDERSEPGLGQTPVGDDLPYVDGSAATPEELRAEITRQTDPQVRHVEQLRSDVAATVNELGGRLDVRPQIAHRLSRRPVMIAAAALLAAVVLRRRLRGPRDSRTDRQH